jgi:hypothetical protein
MNTKIVILGNIVLLMLASQALADVQKPVYLQLDWKPGETHRYKLHLQSDANVEGEHTQISMAFEIALHVIGHNKNGNTTSTDVARQSHTNDEQALSSGERLTEVELEHSAMQINIYNAGQRFSLTVDKYEVSAFLNGRSLPAYQINNMSSELKPLQEILKSPIHLWLTKSGRIVRVSGLEKLDPAMQKELALGYLQGMMLPESPMKVGDHFVDKRSLDSIFPSQGGKNNSTMAGRTVEIVRTLQRIHRNDDRLVAEFSGPVKEKFANVLLDEDGTTGSAEVDVVFTTSYDVDHGTIVCETAKGTIFLRPDKKIGVPDLITVNIDVNVTLIETKESKAVVRNYGRN